MAIFYLSCNSFSKCIKTNVYWLYISAAVWQQLSPIILHLSYHILEANSTTSSSKREIYSVSHPVCIYSVGTNEFGNKLFYQNSLIFLIAADVSRPWSSNKQWKTFIGRDLKDPSKFFEIEIGNSILRLKKNIKTHMYVKATKNFLENALKA